MPKRPSKEEAFKELRTNLTILGVFLLLVRAAPRVLDMAQGRSEERIVALRWATCEMVGKCWGMSWMFVFSFITRHKSRSAKLECLATVMFKLLMNPYAGTSAVRKSTDILPSEYNNSLHAPAMSRNQISQQRLKRSSKGISLSATSWYQLSWSVILRCLLNICFPVSICVSVIHVLLQLFWPSIVWKVGKTQEPLFEFLSWG